MPNPKGPKKSTLSDTPESENVKRPFFKTKLPFSIVNVE